MLVAVPTMLHRMVELAPDVIAKYDTSSLKVILIAGSALTPELSNRVQDTFGDVLYNMYGSTECGFATVATPDELRSAPGTAGRAPVTCEVVLFDENDQRVDGANHRGRIFIRSARTFRGIHRRPATSRSSTATCPAATWATSTRTGCCSSTGATTT